MNRRGELRIGTSGWIYPHWKNVFYPKGCPQRLWFSYYSKCFDTVEINFTFYRLPAKKTFQSWNESAPEGFKFAVKGSRYVTHMKRLSEPEIHVPTFFERARALKDHIGPVLWQLPPSFKRDDERLHDFLFRLPRSYRHTIEFRHDSWVSDDILELLRKHGVAYCIADRTAKPGLMITTAGWTYIRFHQGRGRDGRYTAKQLDEWSETIGDCLKGGIDVWVYFNNDQQGFAVANAQSLRENLGHLSGR